MSAPTNRRTTSKDRSASCRNGSPKRPSSRTSEEDSTSSEKDLHPYWNDSIAAISSRLWLPTGTASLGSALNSSSGWPTKTAARSWFWTTRITAPNRNSPRIFSPSSTPSVADSTGSAATETKSKRIRIYPNREQRQTLKLWLDAARWCYNQTVAYLRQPDTKANWKYIKTAIINAAPERLKAAPYQVKSIAVRDACRAVTRCKQANMELAQAKTHGNRTEEPYTEVGFRSRKNPKQGCYIPWRSITKEGPYPRILAEMHMAEALPANHRDSRLTLHNGQYHLAVTFTAERRTSETQARVVALDPGLRSFLTWFSETDAGHIGKHDFGRIQRLCHRLDQLISRTAKAGARRRRNLRKATGRMRVRITNLIDELHHQAARFLVDNFDLILLPTFETSQMVQRGKRKIRTKSVRSMLTFAHYRFQKFLLWKAWEEGKQVLLVNEAYTSRTCSWNGDVIPNLGGRRWIQASDGVRMERDINGARGIFLRALGDTPSLMQSACIATDVLNVS